MFTQEIVNVFFSNKIIIFQSKVLRNVLHCCHFVTNDVILDSNFNQNQTHCPFFDLFCLYYIRHMINTCRF